MLKVGLPRVLDSLRRQKKWSRDRLQFESGVSVSVIRDLETGQAHGLTLSTLMKLCRCFGVSPNVLLGLNGISEELIPQIYTQWNQIVYVPKACERCGRRLAPGELHTAPECSLNRWDDNASLKFLAASLAVSEDVMQLILADQMEIQRRPSTRALMTETSITVPVLVTEERRTPLPQIATGKSDVRVAVAGEILGE
jgi:DNA-binding Xre family transcriptional regulator